MKKKNAHLATRSFVFWQGKKAKNVVFLYLTSGFAAFIGLWLLVYCQIQTTRLIMFFKKYTRIWFSGRNNKPFLLS